MQITLDVTKEFSVINDAHFLDAGEMKPYIFFDFPLNILDGVFTFELMNFGLNMNDEIEKNFKIYSPYFDDIINCNFKYKNIIIFGKAKFKITNVKGVEVELRNLENEEKLYYATAPYRIEKDDFIFEKGGYSEFSSHDTTLYIISDKNTQATVTFSSDEYILMHTHEPEYERYVATKQTHYNYKSSPMYNTDILKSFDSRITKLFDFNYYPKYFKPVFFQEEGISRTAAFKSEPEITKPQKEKKFKYDRIKRYNFREIRRLTEEHEAKYLSQVEQRFWKEFHDWASKHLKKQLNVEVGENDELYECLTSQLGYRDRKAHDILKMLITRFVNSEFKQ